MPRIQLEATKAERTARKLETTDVWRMLLDPNFQPGPRPSLIHEPLRRMEAAGAAGGAALAGQTAGSNFAGWLFKVSARHCEPAHRTRTPRAGFPSPPSLLVHRFNALLHPSLPQRQQ